MRKPAIGYILDKQPLPKVENWKLEYLTPLDEYISSGSNEISGIKAWFKFSGHKLSLGGQPMTILNSAYWIVLEIHDNIFIFLSHSSRASKVKASELDKQVIWD